ncbi:glutaminyl-peptide cyclotransferase [Dyadobacter sp. CY312]|uniref:glutaminyl-peptide cyclotransferase n=1 Tax=Dyadobacter sp. CY312 TaxID=2907303 RepID=UPI001F3D9E4A|nr:glutaminyl-peptide cyclotransferase [Dyadobacter sp. CY312]MCE7043971.1 glutaminyl-peptide cyclotransferase [Dyadobacter sp. CY312]
MNTLSKNILLVLISVVSFYACQQEKKSENEAVVTEPHSIANLPKSRYTIGDSVKIGFTEPVADFQVKTDGEINESKLTGLDSVTFLSKLIKTGWHQLVVAGKTKSNVAFTDTLRFELVSDVAPKEITYAVAGSFPHLKTSFTEGLEFYKGELYEGTGENGKSQLLKIDLKTGAALKSLNLDPKYFGEGITIVNDKIYQLTWQSGVCFRYNMDFTPDKTFTYYFQGWGLTHRDTTLMMSDGSNKIHFYNTEYEKTGDLEVYDQNGPVRNINELEYLNGYVYANIFETTKIIKIDVATGKVVGVLDMQSIIPAEIDARKDVLNGIAYNSTDQSFYVTGKNWPVMFRIKLKDIKGDGGRNL